MSKAIKLLTDEQSATLLTELQHPHSAKTRTLKGIRNYLMALLMLDTGIRVGELVQLLICDVWIINEPARSLNIRDDIAKRRCGRTVPFTPRLIDAINFYYLSLPAHFQCVLTSFLFTQPTNLKHITVRQVQRIIKSAGDWCLGIPVTPHMLRHTFGTRLMRVTSVRILQELLGHKQLSSTQIYTHPNNQDLKEAIERM